MKLLPVIVVLLFGALGSCGNGASYPAADNAFDAGREFIDGCLKGDFNKAAFYMVTDDENNKQLLQLKRDYALKSVDQKREYAEASIVIRDEEPVSDSVHIIHYMNSYDKTARKVKVVLRNGSWLVDFKYTFNGNL